MATDQKAQVIPGIPLAALDAIADQNVRQVLQAIVDGWHVRNGATGSGDNRFITAGEVGLTGGHSSLAGVGGNNNQIGTGPGPLITPANIARIINDLQALVMESPLFLALGERVDLIDKPGGIFTRLGQVEIVVTNETQTRQTADEAEIDARAALGVRVGAAEGAIVTETTVRANEDSAIVEFVNTQYSSVSDSMALIQISITTVSNAVSSQATQLGQVQASVGANATAIQVAAQASVDADGQINSKYTVKIDVNGYVSGYGLMGSANNAAPFAEFIVRADRFAIGSPSGPGIPPQVPFIVTTTPTMVGGQVVPAGVYIDEAIIKNGSIGAVKIGDAEITTAKIGDAAVDTLKIAGSSVMVGVYDSAGGASVAASSGSINYETLISRTIDLGDSYNTGVVVMSVVSLYADTNATYGLRILVNGVTAGEVRASLQGGYVNLAPVTGFLQSTGRYAVVALQAYNTETGPGSNVGLHINGSTMSITGGKR